MIRFLVTILFVGVLAISVWPAAAAECDGVSFPETAAVGSEQVSLNGLGLRRATFLKVHVYVAGLYLAEKSNDPKSILEKDQAWRLEMKFMRDVEASDMRDAWDEGFENNAGDAVEDLQGRIDKLNLWMADMEEGKILWYGYTPGRGVEVNVNGASKGVIEGSDFARALLSVNLGPEPPTEELQEGLLGGECG